MYPLECSYRGWQCYPVFGVIDQNQQYPMRLTHNLQHIDIILEHRDLYRVNASSVHAQSIFEQMGDMSNNSIKLGASVQD